MIFKPDSSHHGGHHSVRDLKGPLAKWATGLSILVPHGQRTGCTVAGRHLPHLCASFFVRALAFILMPPPKSL